MKIFYLIIILTAFSVNVFALSNENIDAEIFCDTYYHNNKKFYKKCLLSMKNKNVAKIVTDVLSNF